jgi:hypothetical protein
MFIPQLLWALATTLLCIIMVINQRTSIVSIVEMRICTLCLLNVKIMHVVGSVIIVSYINGIHVLSFTCRHIKVVLEHYNITINPKFRNCSCQQFCRAVFIIVFPKLHIPVMIEMLYSYRHLDNGGHCDRQLYIYEMLSIHMDTYACRCLVLEQQRK